MGRALDLFLALARIQSQPGEERAVMDAVRAELAAMGIESTEDDAAARIGGDCGNVLARIPATAPGTPIFLNAHVDTVPVVDALDPVVEDGWVVNRAPAILGADNKASVAGILDGVRRVLEEGVPHAGIEIVITVQEEIGLLGARAFDADALEAEIGFVFDVDGDPGAMVMRASGQIALDVAFRGRAAHAGIAPEEGRSAIHAAALALSRLSMGRVEPGASRNAGTIRGGTQRNVVPEECHVQIEVRAMDEPRVADLAQEVVDAANAAAAETGCSVEIAQHRYYWAYAFDREDDVVRIARAALEAAGIQPREVETGGGADAHAFNSAGKRCLNLSSGMELIHTPDERIRVEHVQALSDITVELIRAAAA